jgi:hypothetical protein
MPRENVINAHSGLARHVRVADTEAGGGERIEIPGPIAPIDGTFDGRIEITGHEQRTFDRIDPAYRDSRLVGPSITVDLKYSTALPLANYHCFQSAARALQVKADNMDCALGGCEVIAMDAGAARMESFIHKAVPGLNGKAAGEYITVWAST